MNIISFYFYWLKHRKDILDELNSAGCTLDEYCIVRDSFIKSYNNHRKLRGLHGFV